MMSQSMNRGFRSVIGYNTAEAAHGSPVQPLPSEIQLENFNLLLRQRFYAGQLFAFEKLQ